MPTHPTHPAVAYPEAEDLMANEDALNRLAGTHALRNKEEISVVDVKVSGEEEEEGEQQQQLQQQQQQQQQQEQIMTHLVVSYLTHSVLLLLLLLLFCPVPSSPPAS